MDESRSGAGGIATTLTVVGWLAVATSVAYGLYVGGEALNQGAPLVEWVGPAAGFMSGLLLLGFASLVEMAGDIRDDARRLAREGRPAPPGSVAELIERVTETRDAARRLADAAVAHQ
jgi:hypothetical protein